MSYTPLQTPDEWNSKAWKLPQGRRNGTTRCYWFGLVDSPWLTDLPQPTHHSQFAMVTWPQDNLPWITCWGGRGQIAAEELHPRSVQRLPRCAMLASRLGRQSAWLGRFATGTPYSGLFQSWGLLNWEGSKLKQDKICCYSPVKSCPTASWPGWVSCSESAGASWPGWVSCNRFPRP